MERILVVEDNAIANKIISRILSGNGYKVDSVFSAEDALFEFNKSRYDLVILDLELPKMSGYTFLQVIRKKSDVPVVVNTSHANVKSRIKLINVGASDFMEKSFDQEQVLESVRFILNDQKSKNKESKIFNYKNLTIDFTSRAVSRNNEFVELTIKEFDILRLLFENPHRAFSRKQLYLIVWGEEYSEFVDNTINVHVKRLRNKIEEKANKPEIIETVYAFGYRLGKAVIDLLIKD